MQETLYLLSSTKSAARLAEGIRDYENGKFVEREPIEE
jgi:PHD/YefM family antitoxin component YafN of YafNO toxin-antitoxin module